MLQTGIYVYCVDLKISTDSYETETLMLLFLCITSLEEVLHFLYIFCYLFVGLRLNLSCLTYPT